MSLFISSLNSGSNGNCFYVGNENEAVLIDAGISCRETEKRMLRLGLSMKKVKAVFITHEHSDHISGLHTLAKKFQLPVYITAPTFQNGRLRIEQKLVYAFKAYEPVKIGNLSVTAFPKHHDACDPHSFIVSHNQVNVGVFTDIGSACQNVIKHFKQCHAAFLEANYDVQLLEEGKYPYHLKNRIRGGYGHLSNIQALKLFTDHRPAYMTHLLLSHLSKHNNNPSLVEEMFMRKAGRTKIVIASRYEETEVYHVRNNSIRNSRANGKARAHFQLSLFQ